MQAADSVTLIGAGTPEKQAPYRLLLANSTREERFEQFPFPPIQRIKYRYEISAKQGPVLSPPRESRPVATVF